MAALVAGLVLGLTVAVAAKKDDASAMVSASFSIPSWISLSVVGNGDVSFGEIAGGGGYVGNRATELRVLSTTSWALASTILWSDSTLPEGASQSIIEKVLDLSFDKQAGSWGVHYVKVSYEMEIEDEQLAELPVGDYNLVIQYTATTD
jgi:hypothetical protein